MEPSLDKGKFLDSMSLSTPSLSSVSTDVAQGMAQGDTSSLAHFGSSDGGEAAPSYRSLPAKPSLLSPFQEREGRQGICGSSRSATRLCQPLKKPNSAGAKPTLYPPSSTAVCWGCLPCAGSMSCAPRNKNTRGGQAFPGTGLALRS